MNLWVLLACVHRSSWINHLTRKRRFSWRNLDHLRANILLPVQPVNAGIGVSVRRWRFL